MHGEHVHVCRGLDARGGKKLRTGTHTRARETTTVTKIKIIIQSAEAHIIIIGENI